MGFVALILAEGKMPVSGSKATLVDDEEEVVDDDDDDDESNKEHLFIKLMFLIER